MNNKGIKNRIKGKTLVKYFHIFFKQVTVSGSSDSDYTTYIHCGKPRLNVSSLCSVQSRSKVTEQDIVMWISDLLNEYLENEFQVRLGSSPRIEDGTYIFQATRIS